MESSLSSIESSSSIEDLDPSPINNNNIINNNIITRTSTIISNIIEDNKFAKSQTVPSPSFNYNEEIEEPEISNKETPTDVKDDGHYNKFDIDNKPPDKGFWAWTAAICVMCINTFSWGVNASFGVYLNYYVTTNYFPGATMEDYVMIGGLGLGLSFSLCAITNGLCRRFNYKIIMLIGTIISFISYWLASISKTVVQLIMFQGFLMSIGWALVAGSTFVILPSWFLKKRSIAQGIATAGGGLAGVIFSRPIDSIIQLYLNDPKYENNKHEGLKLGIAWALRMEAFVCGFILLISILLLRTYRPIKDDSLKGKGLKEFFLELIQFITRLDLIKQVPIFCLILWNMVYGLAYTILLFSLSSFASSIGLSYKQGSNVTIVQSVAQTVGRPMLGIISEKLGRVNTTIIATILITIFVFFYWIFVETYSQLLGFAFVIGFFLGVNWVNFGPMTADVVGGGGKDLNHAISIQMFMGGLPLLIAELVGFKLRRPEMSKPFLYCQILVGIAAIISALLLLPFREWKIKRILVARRKILNDKFQNDDNDIITDPNLHENEIKRLDYMLQNNTTSYIIRMFYPIAV